MGWRRTAAPSPTFGGHRQPAFCLCWSGWCLERRPRRCPDSDRSTLRCVVGNATRRWPGAWRSRGGRTLWRSSVRDSSRSSRRGSSACRRRLGYARTRATPSAPSGIAEAAQGRKPHQGRVDRINRKADRVQGKRTDPIASVRPGPLVGGADLLAELLQLQHPRAERLELIR